MRQQVKFVFQIGLPALHQNFMYDIARDASSMCGGCTTDIKRGYWMTDEDRHQSVYIADLEQEVCFQLELTCEMHKKDNVYAYMVGAICATAELYEVETDWVHVSEIPMTGRHFSVASLNATPTEKDAA